MITAYALLGLFWFAVLNQFYGAMRPRFSHLGAAGRAINDWPCGCPQCDFSGFWPAGLLARAHQFTTLYQPAAFLAYRHAVFWPQAERVLWFYPPPALLPSMAISYLPFEAAFFVWVTGLTLATLLLLRWARLSWAVIGLTLLSPALLWNVELGQLGAISNGLVVAGLLMADQAPWVTGIVLGLLVFKPQSGLLAPIALLARWNFRAIAAAALVVLAI